MKIYFIRHGESQANISKAYNSRNNSIHSLTEKGVLQIENCAEELKNIKFDAFYSSGLLRARESAAIICEKAGVNFEIDFNIREIDMGIYEGKAGDYVDRTYRQLLSNWIVEDEKTAKISKGENYNSVIKRFENFILKLEAKGISSNSEINVAVLSHAGFIRTVVPAITENLPKGYTYFNKIKNGAVAVVDLSKKVCLKWGEEEFCKKN